MPSCATVSERKLTRAERALHVHGIELVVFDEEQIETTIRDHVEPPLVVRSPRDATPNCNATAKHVPRRARRVLAA